MQTMGFDRILGGVCAPKGFLAAGVHCGIKKDGRPDLALVYSDRPARTAGVFTTNEVKAAPVLLTRELVGGASCRAVVINSGNANALTGERGMDDARSMARTLEEDLGLSPGEALVASTGVIGSYLPIDRVTKGIDNAVEELNPGGNTDAAKAIMTTDTYPKELAVELQVGGETVRMGAMAKGSGMVHPHLATIICVITTDLAMETGRLEEWLKKAAEWSFNRISVDGDQSTNDMVLMLANGAACDDGYSMTPDEEALAFRALCWLTGNLAMALIKDGEGATKLLRIVVNGAANDAEAVRVARAIANSNLLKCAFFGGMSGTGRIAAAAGNAGVPLEQEKMSVYLGEHRVLLNGVVVDNDPEDLDRVLKRDEVEVTLDLQSGSGSAYFLSTDLSKEYVEINAFEKS